jgi:membrane protein
MRNSKNLRHLWHAVRQAVAHDVFTLAKAASYSAVVSLFPALLVLVFLLGLNPEAAGLQHTLNTLVTSLLPPNIVPVILNYVSTEQHAAHSVLMLSWTGVVSFLGAQGVLLTLMEGFRRAYAVRRFEASRWNERVKAFFLVPLSVVPMALASALILYGHQIEAWMFYYTDHQIHFIVVLGWRLMRWIIALSSSVVVLMVIYRYGIPVRHKWRTLFPGAALATVMWFGATLLFGWYVGHFAHYTQIYGQLGSGIALLFWLYMVAYSILVGAEFNAQRKHHKVIS